MCFICGKCGKCGQIRGNGIWKWKRLIKSKG
jgi:Fe2+ or Zn2+ uptake regulation protein